MTLSILCCPICESQQFTYLLQQQAGNFDNSSLYEVIEVRSCNSCGHIYNKLQEHEVNGLWQYYEEEYAQINLASSTREGDVPGTSNKNTLQRFDNLLSLVEENITPSSKVLDIGCALGGLLKQLHNKGVRDLHGVDLTESYVKELKKQGFVKSAEQASAESLPYQDNQFDVVFLDQVLEHTISPNKVFSEVNRVLKSGGFFVIGVPDAARYSTSYFFDFFWFLMREHIQHFDLDHIELLGKKWGFSLYNKLESQLSMMSDRMRLPNLNVCLQKSNKSNNLSIDQSLLPSMMFAYFEQEQRRLEQRQASFRSLIDDGVNFYFWGIGRECLYLLENIPDLKSSTRGLIDVNEFKQHNLSFMGMKVESPQLIQTLSETDAIVISAVAHTDVIERSINSAHFKGKIVKLT